MEKRRIGRGGPEITPVGLGCMGMSEFYGTPTDESEAIRLIHRALDEGVDFFDTSDAYGPFTNERLLGKALADRRDRAVIATKFAVQRGEDGSFLGISGRPEYVKQACDASLSRLGVDAIDVYYQHRVDRQTPIEDTVGALADLVQAGKIRHIGLSEAAPDTLRRAAKVAPIAALQTEYSLWTRDPEDELLALCAELGTTFVAYSPLGRGFLTGKIKSLDDLDPKDWRRLTPRFQQENFEKNLELVAKVESLAAEKKCSPAQLALAWVLRQAEHVVAIPGTTKLERVKENLGALDVSLTDGDLEAIDAIAPRGVAAGDRYNAAGMSSLNG